MKKMILKVLAAACIAGAMTACAKKADEPVKRNYMWFDCEANYERLSSVDSICYYLDKVKEVGFTDVVVDVKSIMGEVLYKSDIAPFMGEWEGHYRSESFDMMKIFIKEGHKRGLRVFGSLNVFCGGHNYFNRGIVYKMNPDWVSLNYEKGELIPLSKIKKKYGAMLNPCNPEVRDYQLSVLKEFVSKYPKMDGIIFDRVRFDGITSDFSQISKEEFEKYAGITVENFPEDIISWYDENGNVRSKYNCGPLFNKWVEFRAMTIHNFVQTAHKELKAINPKLIIGDYTGAWYPSYYELGVNWASDDYDPSQKYWWATPEYKNTGYAKLLDVYMTGLYYTQVTKAEVDAAAGVVGERNEAAMKQDRSYWYCVEGGAEEAMKLTEGATAPVLGSIYVDQYLKDMSIFPRAARQAYLSTDGLMIFDICHIINHNLWDEFEAIFAE